MQDHSITYRPYGLGASFFYDTCGITAGNQARGGWHGVKGGGGQNEEVAGVEGDYA